MNKRPRGVAAPVAKFAVVVPLETLYARGRDHRDRSAQLERTHAWPKEANLCMGRLAP